MKNSSLTKTLALWAALALTVGTSAHAGIYTFNYSDTGPLYPNAGNKLTFSHTEGGMPSLIQEVLLTPQFTSSAGLSAGDIQGRLYLGTGSSPYYESITTSSPTFDGTYYTTTIDFGSGSAFYGQNPNSQWTLNLWDNNVSFGNTLAGSSLEITAVPEPVNVALGIFGGLFGGVLLVQIRPVRNRLHRCRVAFVQWVDAV